MRRRKTFKPILQTVPKGQSLAQLIQRANRLQTLEKQLFPHLPSQVKGLFSLANIRDDTAVLLCKTPMEASKVRMYSRAILQILQQKFKVSVKKILVKVE